MRRKLVFATNNAHKLEKVSSILADKVELLGLDDINCHTNVPEAADTPKGSAYLKSSSIYQSYRLDCFGDDTGLEVEMLGETPGTYSARFTREEGYSAEVNILRLMQELEEKEDRRAQSCIAISLILGGKKCLFEGVIKGEIIKKKRGDSGFGYDPIFIPEGYDRTFTELGDGVKSRTSHHILAVNKLCELLRFI